MRLLVLLFALSMPLVAWMSQRGVFGPTQGEISDRYPTLLVAAGWAFSIWGLIFLLDVVYALWQLTGDRRRDIRLTRIAPYAAGGFALTTIWMPLFSMGLFWACLVVIFAALACVARAAWILSRYEGPRRVSHLWGTIPLSLHAGWLSLAAFLNLAQVIVAHRLLPTDDMLGWSLALLAATAVVLFVLNHGMRGNVAYAAAAIWGLVAVHVKQSGWTLEGADVVAWSALALAVLLGVQTAWLVRRHAHRRDSMSDHAAPGHHAH